MKPLPDPLRNIAPRNWTQTAYARFLRMPGGEIKTAFTESQAEFNRFTKDALKTSYDEFWRQEEGVR